MSEAAADQAETTTAPLMTWASYAAGVIGAWREGSKTIHTHPIPACLKPITNGELLTELLPMSSKFATFFQSMMSPAQKTPPT